MIKFKWYFWVILFILVVLVFPKPCGSKLPSIEFEYTCYGFQAPFIELAQKPEEREDWCSGICAQKSLIPKNNTVSNATTDETPGPISDVMGTFMKIIPALGLIVAVIVVVSFINSIQQKGGGSKITVIKGPGQ